MTSFVEDDCLYIVQEFAQNGDLQTVIKRQKEKQKKRMKETELWAMMYELLLGIKHLHDNGIIHRDLKPLNIFLNSKRCIKIGDLGVAKLNDSTVVPTLQDCQISDNKVGTPLYLAPELVMNKKYDYKVDVWAAGVIMYYLTALSPPFSGDNISDLGVSITTTTPRELSNYYTNKYKSLLKSFLSKDPAERPTVDEAIEKVPDLIKKAYISQFRFTDVKENNGFISSRDSPLKRADDLPSAVIPIPVYKKTVTMTTDKLSRPITTHSNKNPMLEIDSRPNTGHENRRLNLKHAVNVSKMRVLSSLNGRTSTQSKEREFMKPTRDKVYIRDIIQCTDETPK